VLPVGTVSAVEGLSAVRASPGILAADLYFGPGATINCISPYGRQEVAHYSPAAFFR